ncbi:nucleotide pyrophosphohydrolase [Thiothrix litoralis]|jgi:NTP pyrophosphatase (non-canonical NTP hydrolase)|uniref:Nucleotide pyrophosphohydrolase n=1 Tax=Thiothrix litoralis TaxID=2891210 RepID=A0ABX7WN39_9GAMM|nr:nucleotide pyrophosphohydrolase [Thiothrix litoralis]QTR44472.1 nucleotide pyrophosphohydrolase [Thiothrix litoralis]
MLPKDLVDELMQFRAERDWQQFHTPRNLAISLSLEAGEVLELFQWEDRQGEALESVMPRLRDEVADVAVYLTYLCTDLGIDLEAAIREKMLKNRAKYPVALSKGSAKKYTEL